MVEFISVWSGQPVYINPAHVTRVDQRTMVAGGTWWWVAGHSRVWFATSIGQDEEPYEDVIGHPRVVATTIGMFLRR